MCQIWHTCHPGLTHTCFANACTSCAHGQAAILLLHEHLLALGHKKAHLQHMTIAAESFCVHVHSKLQVLMSNSISKCCPKSLPPLEKGTCGLQAGVGSHGTEDHELWLQYAAFEQQHLKGAGHVYWRAVKALESPDSFVSACSGA